MDFKEITIRDFKFKIVKKNFLARCNTKRLAKGIGPGNWLMGIAEDDLIKAQTKFFDRPNKEWIKIPDSVFALTDEVIAKNQKGAFIALENFFGAATAEEKTTFIKIIGLLADQLRSLLVVSLLGKEGKTNDQIAESLGWSGARVFITAKNLKNISTNKIKQLLGQLLLIDSRIKSSDTNTKLDIDLFLVSATQ